LVWTTYWEARDTRVMRIDVAAGSAPQKIYSGNPTELATEGDRVVLSDDDAEGDEQVFLWHNGITVQITPVVSPEEFDHGDDLLAIGGQYIVYDKGDDGPFFYDLTTGREYLVTTDQLPRDGRMDGNSLVWRSDHLSAVRLVLFQHPDLSLANLTFSDDHPREGSKIDATVVVGNDSDFDFAHGFSLQLYDGDPASGGIPLGPAQVVHGGLAAGGQTTIYLEDVPVPRTSTGAETELHDIHARLELAPYYDNPGNNTAVTILAVLHDNEGPLISDVQVSEHDGDGDGIIGSDEHAHISWIVTDPDGIGAVELLIDGIAIPSSSVSVGADGTCDATVALLGPGSHSLLIRASDAADSPANSEHADSFDVVRAESVEVSYAGIPVPANTGEVMNVGNFVAKSNVELRFTIENGGEQQLLLGDLTCETLVGSASCGQPSIERLAPAATASFIVQPDTSLIGTFRVALSLVSSDSEKSPMAWVIEGVIEPEPVEELVRTVLETTDLEGNPILAVVEGEPFLLQFFVEDRRAVPSGVFAWYSDVTYDDNLVGIGLEEIVYGTSYPNVQAGDVSHSGLIDEVGGVAGLTPLGPGRHLVFSVEMIAKSEGQTTFTADSADWLPYHDVLLFARDDAVPASQIDFGSTTIDVLPAVVATGDTAVTNEDEVVTVSVLANDVGCDLEVFAFDAESQLGAKISRNEDGSLRYDPRDCEACQALPPGQSLQDTFAYTIQDSYGTTDTAIVTVAVEGVNDAPTVANAIADQTAMPRLVFSLTIPENAFVDVDGDPLSYTASLEDGSPLPGWLSFDAPTRILTGTPATSDVGTLVVVVTATDDGEPELGATDVFSIRVINPHQNPANPYDVNGDGFVTPLDALILINRLNEFGPGELPMPPVIPYVPPPYLDVNGDLLLTPLDPLRIINFLDGQTGEGEAADATLYPGAVDCAFSEAERQGRKADDALLSRPSRLGERGRDDVFLDRRFVAEAFPARNAGVASKEMAADCMLPSDAWLGYDDPLACLGGNGSRP